VIAFWIHTLSPPPDFEDLNSVLSTSHDPPAFLIISRQNVRIRVVSSCSLLVRGFACLHARLHDLDVALPGRFRRSRRRSARPPPPLLRLSTPHSRLELIGGSGRRPGRRTAGRVTGYVRATRLLRAPSFRRYFADRLRAVRAGAGRRSGIGRRQGRVRSDHAGGGLF
jgi:hypothetical protein